MKIIAFVNIISNHGHAAISRGKHEIYDSPLDYNIARNTTKGAAVVVQLSGGLLPSPEISCITNVFSGDQIYEICLGKIKTNAKKAGYGPDFISNKTTLRNFLNVKLQL